MAYFFKGANESSTFAVPTHHHHLCQQTSFITTITRGLRRYYEAEAMTRSNSDGSLWSSQPSSPSSAPPSPVRPMPPSDAEELDATFMYSHWIDFISSILPHLVTFAPTDVGTVVQCYTDIVMNICGVTNIEARHNAPGATGHNTYTTPRKHHLQQPQFSVNESRDAVNLQRARALVNGIIHILRECLLVETQQPVADEGPLKTRLGAVLAGMTHMFSSKEASDSAAPEPTMSQARSAVLKHTTGAIEALIRIGFTKSSSTETQVRIVDGFACDTYLRVAIDYFLS